MSAKTTKPAAIANDVAATVETAAKDAAATMQDAFASLRDKLEVPAAARELVQRTAATAKERLADAHANVNNATVSYEKAMSSMVNSGATAMRSLLQAHFDNSVAAIAAMEKIVAAKSVTEAYRIQSEFARDYASANWARVQSAAETVKSNVEESVKMLQDEAAKAVATFKKAA